MNVEAMDFVAMKGEMYNNPGKMAMGAMNEVYRRLSVCLSSP